MMQIAAAITQPPTTIADRRAVRHDRATRIAASTTSKSTTARQVPGADVGLTHNVGGIGQYCFVHVFRRG